MYKNVPHTCTAIALLIKSRGIFSLPLLAWFGCRELTISSKQKVQVLPYNHSRPINAKAINSYQRKNMKQ